MEVLGLSAITRSVTLKLLVVGVLSAVLFVPLMMVWALVGERSGRRDDVAREVSAVWGGPQRVGGLALSIPIIAMSVEGSPVPPPVRHLVVLPESLHLDVRLEPEVRRRSIFDVVVYRAQVVATGEFRLPMPDSMGLATGDRVDPARAALHVGVSDLRGVVSLDDLQWGGAALEAGPSASATGIGPGLSAPVTIDGSAAVPFRVEMTLAGASQLMFLPSGRQTDITMSSPWASPGFTGVRLPDRHETAPDGFRAEWHSNFLSRPYPQVWMEVAGQAGDGTAKFEQAAFGVSLVTPVDHYRQTERAVKYGFLFIVLTFGLVVVREFTGGRRVHPVQYLFVGLALVIFYLLLLSLSEQIAFPIAYATASIATVGLIGAYSVRMLNGAGDGLILTGALGTLYGVLFVLLRLEDLALLVGAVVVFVALALAMYLTRRIDWYAPAETQADRSAS